MSRTASQIAGIVQSRIGNRAGGLIGQLNVEDAILNSINDGIYDIAKRENVSAFQRRATIAIVTTAYQYALPVLDVDSNVIRVNQILKARFVRTGESYGYNLTCVSQRRYDSMFPYPSSARVGSPSYYMQTQGQIEIFPYPSTSGVVYVRCSIWPDRITINQEQPLGAEYDDVIEAYATSDIMASLQMNDDSNIWLTKYAVRLSIALQNEKEQPDWEPSLHPDSYNADGGGNQPQFDPSVRSM